MKPLPHFLYGSYDRKINNLSITVIKEFLKNREYCLISDYYNEIEKITHKRNFEICYDYFKIDPRKFD